MARPDFDQVVNTYHLMLYRFALSLTRHQSDALDLTQQTFYLWATRGNQLRDGSKVKTWLFTTLYREFLATRRRGANYSFVPLETVQHEVPAISPDAIEQTDAGLMMDALLQVDEVYRAPLMLFYVDDCPYKEIAALLGVPIGTVMSRIARGKEQLRRLLADRINSMNLIQTEVVQ